MSLRESQGEFQRNDRGCELSLYNSGIVVQADEVAVQMARLRAAFPKQSELFFNILAERVLKNKFTREKLRDAVNHMIDNFSYKEFNVSDVIRFDRRVRLYTYDEVGKLITQGLASFSDFEIKNIDGVNYRIKKQTCENEICIKKQDKD